MTPPRGIRTRTTSRRAEQEESIADSVLTEQPLQESDAQSAATHDPISTRGSTSKVDQPDDNPLSVVQEDSDIDTMPYPYPQYNEEAGAETHVCAFLTTWESNHVS